MNDVDSAASVSAEPKRPARITGKVARRRSVPVVPPPSDEPVPGFEETAAVIIDSWSAAFTEIGESEGAFAVEVYASSNCAILAQLGRIEAARLIDGSPFPPLISELSRRRDALSLAMLTCFGFLDDDELGLQARLAAQEARARGIVGGEPPSWIAELDQPCAVDECAEIAISGTDERMLLVAFSRSGRRHALAVMVDDTECGEALMIMPIEPSRVLQGKGLVEAGRRLLEPRTRVEAVVLDPAEARFRLETAIARRADHDDDLEPAEVLEELMEQTGPEEDALDDEEGAPPYLPLLPLLTSRLAVLPEHGRTLPPHPAEERQRAKIELVIRDVSAGPAGRGRKPLSAMPRKRKKSDGPAPVYRVRVDLKWAKPPIWRRLELAGDATLAAVHRLIQAAFEWDDYHLHAFETEYGPYGNAGADLRHRETASVTLEQLLRAPGEVLEYTYDFGDGWTHVIKLEAILEPEPGLTPRCLTGRRAAPPEDCGGIWGYEEDGGPSGPDTFDRDGLNEALAEIF